jgi:hypothetical protein
VFWGIASDVINYLNAYELYEYAFYQYNHNKTVFDTLDQADLTQLFHLASQQQVEFNSPNIAGDVSSIAGQTLTAVVLQQFQDIIDSASSPDKMALLFGSFEPMMAFFSLSGLASGPSATRFNSLPLHGSVMSFELFSLVPVTGNTTFPDPENLWVRFLFRNGTDDDEKLVAYPLFGRGNDQTDILWSDFSSAMGNFEMETVAGWCGSCQNVNSFCTMIASDVDITPTATAAPIATKHSLSPTVGGVIGAAVTLGILAILALVLIVFGFRIDRRTRGNSAQGGGIGVLRRNGSGGGGGFKGAEKLASDTDLHLKGGAGASVIRHERVGSWELNESPTSPAAKHLSLDKELESGRVVSTADYSRRKSEDITRGLGDVDPFQDPVKPVDQV